MNRIESFPRDSPVSLSIHLFKRSIGSLQAIHLDPLEPRTHDVCCGGGTLTGDTNALGIAVSYVFVFREKRRKPRVALNTYPQSYLKTSQRVKRESASLIPTSTLIRYIW